MGRILAVCASPARGTEKRRVGAGRFTPEWGLVGDAHGGDWHRQVSLLSAEKIKAFNARGAGVASCPGKGYLPAWWKAATSQREMC